MPVLTTLNFLIYIKVFKDAHLQFQLKDSLAKNMMRLSRPVATVCPDTISSMELALPTQLALLDSTIVSAPAIMSVKHVELTMHSQEIALPAAILIISNLIMKTVFQPTLPAALVNGNLVVLALMSHLHARDLIQAREAASLARAIFTNSTLMESALLSFSIVLLGSMLLV